MKEEDMIENIHGMIGMNEVFTITGHRSISDHTLKRLYDLSDFDGIISVTERLNKLAETNKKQSEIIDITTIDTAEQLEKHYNYAIQQMNKNIDDIIVYEAYDVLRLSIKDIAEELGVELE